MFDEGERLKTFSFGRHHQPRRRSDPKIVASRIPE
jgi:hypothetical protein